MSILTQFPEKLYSPTAFDGVPWGRDFDLRTARACMWLSQLAYEADPDKIKRILTAWKLRLVNGDAGIVFAEVNSILPLAATHALVVAGHGVTIVAFEGTDPLSAANWITDLDARIGWAGTATGYTTAVDAAWPQIEALIRARPAEHAKIYLTGHSLGGALAVIAAHRIKTAPVAEVEAVYTYGMPRPGSVAFAAGYDATGLGMRTYRLVHADDLVPTVAPSDIVFQPSGIKFRHVGRFLHVERGGRFAAAGLAGGTGVDAPPFVEGIVREVASWVSQPLSNIQSALGRLRLAAALSLGLAPGMRSDPVGIAIELLPPRVRDHIQDRYLGAL